MIKFDKIQPIDGYYFTNFLLNKDNNKGEIKTGRFVISLANKPDNFEIVKWGPKCNVPINKSFKLAHPAFRNIYFNIKFSFTPQNYKKPMLYIMMERLLGIQV